MVGAGVDGVAVGDRVKLYRSTFDEEERMLEGVLLSQPGQGTRILVEWPGSPEGEHDG